MYSWGTYQRCFGNWSGYMFANLHSYLIWNECHSHFLSVTVTGANSKAKWTNRWLVCAPLCSQGLSVLLLIRLIMHPESILQHVPDWTWCMHMSVSAHLYPRAFMGVLLTAQLQATSCTVRSIFVLEIKWWKKKLRFVNLPLKAPAVNGNSAAKEPHVI